MVKKIVSLGLVLFLLCGFAQAEEASPLVGTWYLVEVTYEGMTVSANSDSVEVVMTVHADGTCLLMDSDNAYEVTWHADENGNLIVTHQDGFEEEYVLHEDGSLHLSVDDEAVIFRKETPVAAERVYLSGLTKQDYTGQWLLTYAEFEGMTLTADKLGMDLRLSLKNAAGSLSGLIDTARISVFSTGTPKEEPATTVAPARTALTISDGYGFNLVFYMCEDGSMVTDMQGITMIFLPVTQ